MQLPTNIGIWQAVDLTNLHSIAGFTPINGTLPITDFLSQSSFVVEIFPVRWPCVVPCVVN